MLARGAYRRPAAAVFPCWYSRSLQVPSGQILQPLRSVGSYRTIRHIRAVPLMGARPAGARPSGSARPCAVCCASCGGEECRRGQGVMVMTARLAATSAVVDVAVTVTVTVKSLVDLL